MPRIQRDRILVPGPTGATGPQGQTGATGATGPQGPPGTTDHLLLANIGANSHAAIDTHVGSTANPHSTTKAQVGLGNADNTSDAAKPISTATQTALNAKADTTHTHPLQVMDLMFFGAALSWTNMPAAETEYQSTERYRFKYDLASYTSVRMMATVSAIGTASSILKIQYSTNGTTWVDLGVSISLAALGLPITAWTAIPAGAKSDVFFRIVGSGGDGAADPTLASVRMQVR